MSRQELPKERLATTDEQGRRVFLYPREVKGRYKRMKNRVHAVLLLILLVLPWIRIGGHQAVLLDIPRRRFAIFGMTFWAHDVPVLFLVAAVLILIIMFVTAIWGRAWCGWACPQTVFIEAIFRRIETFAEGDSVTRKRRDAGPWNAEKALRKGLKWGLYLLATLIVTHSLLAYFVGTDRVFEMMSRSPGEHPVAFGITMFATAFLLFDFGWFREQFCTIVCPYGRFQSVLQDQDSLAVVYDKGRGEPRKGTPEALQAGREGDCVDCFRCVTVCPYGVDIRRGANQMECIHCTACMDACDDVMTRLKKPTGLIRYDTERGIKGLSPKARHFRPRVFVIGGALLLVSVGLSTLLALREDVELSVLRPKDMVYQLVPGAGADGGDLVLNRFVFEAANQGFEPVRVTIALSKEASEQGVVLLAPSPTVEVAPGMGGEIVFMARFPKSLLLSGSGRAALEARISGPGDKKLLKREELRLAGPLR